jgi:thiamine-monophosphate kinase
MPCSTASPACSARTTSRGEGGRALDEFQRIARFYAPLAAPGALGLTDDAALIQGPDGSDIVLTADAIVEGVHFLADDPPDLVARKLLRVNLSDLAAKGAKPLGYLLTTSLPERCGEDWLAGFAAGLAADQSEFGIGLLGGDSTRTSGPISLSLTALGTVPRGTMPRRAGAKPGDAVFVTGTIGDAALGLLAATGRLAGLAQPARDFLAGRYRLPEPRSTLGPRLAPLVHAMLDVSDGLVADLDHICDNSAVSASIGLTAVPLSPAAREALQLDSGLIETVLGGGDDYELLFAAPLSSGRALDELAAETGIPITAIGRISAGKGARVVDANGIEMAVERRGWRHF